MNDESAQQPNNNPTENPQQPEPVIPQASEPQPSSKPKKVTILVVAAVVLVVGMLGLFVKHHSDAARQQRLAVSKVYKVGVLDGLDVFFGGSVTSFKQKMTQLGYEEGKNITYDVQKPASLTGNQAVFKKFVQDKDDLIVSLPTEPSLEAEQATKGTNIPIVAMNMSVEGTGVIDTIQHPGHNLAGVRFPGPEYSVRRLQILHQLSPTATRVLVPYLKDYPNVPAQLTAMQAAAKTLGQTITAVPLAPGEIAAYVAGLSATNPGFDAIVGAAEPFAATPALNAPLYTFADQHNLPILASGLSNDATGPIVSVIPSNSEVGASGATLADKIFKGAKAGTLPIVTPTGYLSVNLKVAQRLGITPDPGLLSTATQIVR